MIFPLFRRIQPWQVALATLLGMTLALAIAHSGLRSYLGFFNLDKEQSLKAVFSGLQLLSIAVLSFLYALLQCKAIRQRKQCILWTLVGMLFGYLALDDMMTIHERVGFVLNRWTGLTGYWGESFNWLIYFSPLILIGLVVLFLAVKSLRREYAPAGSLAWIGITLFVASLLFEYIGGRMLASSAYQWLIVVEEVSMLAGESFFLVAFWRTLGNLFSRSYVARSSTMQ